MPEFNYGVAVKCETPEQAEQVMAERLSPDEDYGFEYMVIYYRPGERPTSVVRPLVYEEDQIEEFVALAYEACREHLAPNWTIDFLKNGLDAEWLRVMAERWRENEFEPVEFAGRVERLADAIAHDEGSRDEVR